MTALLLSPFYILFNIYIAWRLLGWLAACHRNLKKRPVRIAVAGVYGFLALSILIAFLLPPSSLQRLLKLISNYWLGTFLYILLTVLAADGIRLLLLHLKFRYSRKIFTRRGYVAAGALCIAVITAFTATGIWGAGHIFVTDYDIHVEKPCGERDSLKIVLTADLHLGYSIGIRHMENMVEKINAQNPDLVVIAGDIFDNEYDALEDPKRLAEVLSGIKSTYGVYACYGNHDIKEKLLAGFTLGGRKEEKASDPRMDSFLEDAKIHLLKDEGVLIDNAFYLYGRPDAKNPGLGSRERLSPRELTASMDKTLPIIVIDHQPKELEGLAEAGVDLDLCGHTHDGQMFPGNLLVSLMWENSCGYLQKGGMHSIVTSGVGVFGPNMRVGTKSEICSITVSFAGNKL